MKVAGRESFAVSQFRRYAVSQVRSFAGTQFRGGAGIWRSRDCGTIEAEEWEGNELGLRWRAAGLGSFHSSSLIFWGHCLDFQA